MTPRITNQAAAQVQNTERTGLIHALMILAAVTIVYLNSLSGVFVFDDDHGIVNNPLVHDICSFAWLNPWARPVTTLTFAINYAVGGLDPIGYHIVNLAIHAANAVLLYCLFTKCVPSPLYSGQRVRVSGSASHDASTRLPQPADSVDLASRTRNIAFAAAVLWAVHPLCTASVTYLIQRGESLAVLGMLATLVCWLRATESSHDRRTAKRWFIAALGFSMIAYGSKESSAFLPLILLLFDRVFLSTRWSSLKPRWDWYLAIALPVMIGIGIYTAAFISGEQHDPTVGFTVQRIDGVSYLASQPFVFMHYLRLAVVPIGQSVDYGWLPSNDPAMIAGGLAAWLVVLGVTFWLLLRRPPLGFLLAASLLVLAPSSSIVPLQDIVFEHRMYLPLAALCVFAVQLADRTLMRYGLAANRLAVMFGVCAVLGYGSLSIVRNQDYRSREQLLAVDVEHHPGNPRALANLAAERDFANVDDRIAMYRRSLELYEQRGYFYAGAEYKLRRAIADLYFLTGRPLEAKPFYSQAIHAANDSVQQSEIHLALALIESGQGDNDAADQQFEWAIGKADSLPGLHETYAVHLRRSGRDSLADQHERIAKQK